MNRRRAGARTAALALALLPLGCAPGGAPSAPTPAAPLRGLDAYVRDAVQDWGVSGLAIAVVKDDSVVFARGYGVREVGKPEPVDENTLFAIGSNTKLFTSVAVATLVDEGKMGWDDPAARHLPGFQLHDPYVTREITVRDLLAHRSGLGRRGDALWYATPLDRGEILRRIRHLEPNSSFRSQYGYQNVMYLAAGETAARVAGSSWDQLVRQRILEPLGMRRTNTSVTALSGDDNVATPHLSRDGALKPVPYRNIDNIGPAGSINSSAREMTQWVRMLLNEGEHDGRRIVSEAALREILTPHTIIPFEADSLFPSTHFRMYGLGAVLQDYRGKKLVWHTGGIDGMLSLVGLVPEEELGVVVLTSTAGHNDLFTALMYRVVDAYLGGPTRDWSATLLRRVEEREQRAAAAEQRTEAARVAGTRPSLALERYAGSYRDELYGEATVALDDGRLVLRRGPTLVADLEHWHFDTFRVNWRDPAMGRTLATFRLDPMGRAAEMEIQNLASFRRAPEGASTSSP